ncbi:Trypsin-like serine proteases, typically periplasmic, contain C-terminal PDZ domain [Alteromonadaceae bacterium Bs31]|nr:Trypsin-like serine proteases, typically periplasmic, contain C-terminal PDZ domain [Alteromonadaceae bacterium Bs31]
MDNHTHSYCQQILLLWVFTLSVLLSAIPVQAQQQSSGQAEKAFAEFGSSIYQVRIINIKSQNLNSSGSGFYVGDGQLFATNYHVVSSVVLEPDEYKIIIEMGPEKVELDVVAIDVVNDLALLRVPRLGKALSLRESIPAKGEKMFSIGNPHNIGMTIVEGNYNGLADDYVFDRIHFSGALNPGMSGGPTIDAKGRVVGVNVQTAGNQVGFLVPVEKLSELLSSVNSQKAESEELDNLSTLETYQKLQLGIGNQILASTAKLIEEINETVWPREELADGLVVGKIHPGFHCWGQSDTDEKDKITTVRKSCNSRQSIYVSSELSSGFFEYEFQFVEAEEWPETAFYQYASLEFSQGRPSNRAGEDDVDNFSCINDVIERKPGEMRRKAAFCSRPYKKYPGLYDVFYMAVTTQKNDRALMEHFCLSGVSKENSDSFLQKFISQVEWK